MNRRTQSHPDQLGFDALLTDTDAINRERIEEAAHAHLPGTMEEAVPYYWRLIKAHHAAMLAGDIGEVSRLRGEAHDLAYKLNGFEPGILADEDAPGCVLARLTQAKDGDVPLWGQSGSFEVRYRDMRVQIDIDGLFGIGATSMSWPGFSASAIETDKPFLSETGYRSFLGVGGGLAPGYTPETFALGIIEAHVQKALKGKLVCIEPTSWFALSRSRHDMRPLRPMISCDGGEKPRHAATKRRDPTNLRAPSVNHRWRRD